MIDKYLRKLGYMDVPDSIKKYFNDPQLLRLKEIGYFCGMDYASKDIYSFLEKVSRYDHSLAVCLMTYHLSGDVKMSLAGLYHDISTPCFSHVIDYMNQDYEKQESTENYTKLIMSDDDYLKYYLKRDGISLDDIINFKKYSIVDNSRPKLCADRLDGVILNGFFWAKTLDYKDVSDILDDMIICQNEEGEDEIGFNSYDIASLVVDTARKTDILCHSDEDNYMMSLLATITRLAIEEEIITYSDLYYYDEKQIFSILKNSDNELICKLLLQFETIKNEEIPQTFIKGLKVRDLNPIVKKKRFL